MTRGAVREPDLFILGVLQAEYHNSLKNGFHEHHLLNAPNTFSTFEFDSKKYIIKIKKKQDIKNKERNPVRIMFLLARHNNIINKLLPLRYPKKYFPSIFWRKYYMVLAISTRIC